MRSIIQVRESDNSEVAINLESISYARRDANSGTVDVHFEGTNDHIVLDGSAAKEIWKALIAIHA